MNRRKIAYLLAIVLLLVPLALLSQPATKHTPGGTLARLRTQHKLSQANLGEIDAAGETMKLATLGLRVVAVMLQWSHAQHYMMHKDWNNFASAVEQLTKLEPNIVSFWRHQGWNTSYNVAVEFDDYRDRYFWVVKGIKFLMEGAKRNVSEPNLNWDIGWFIAQKIGTADERQMYRKLFRADNDFHGDRKRSERDNWRVGRLYFLEAEQVVDRTGVGVVGVRREGSTQSKINPTTFHSDPPKCLINYAKNLEDDGVFLKPGEDNRTALAAWLEADQAWTGYGRREIMSVRNYPIRLADEEDLRETARKARSELDSLAPEGTREVIRQERLLALSEPERTALETSTELRNDEQRELAARAEQKIKVLDVDVAGRTAADRRAQALQLAETIARDEERAESISIERDVVNYKYWRVRCKAEATENAVRGREALHEAIAAFQAARLLPAEEAFDRGFAQWRLVLDKFPDLLENDVTVSENLNDAIDQYRKLLDQLDKPFPKPFVLQDFLDRQAAAATP